MPTLTERIRAIRKSLQYTHELMAHELGIAQTTYSYFENSCEDSLTIGRLRKVASIFKMSLTELINVQSTIQINCVSLNEEGGNTNGVVLRRTELLSSSRTIGGRIRYLREKRNLRQYDMASQMGISQKTLSLMESDDDDVQKVGRLKQAAACLSLASWSDLLPLDQSIFIGTISKNQRGGQTNDPLFGPNEALHIRIQELEEIVIRLAGQSDRQAV